VRTYSDIRSSVYQTIMARNDARKVRQDAIRLNASRRMRGLSRLPVPDDPGKVYIPVAYEADGTYAGILESVEDCPEGCHVVIETR